MAQPAIDPLKDRLLDAILTHVPFDGWTEQSFAAAIADTDVDEGVARGLCPRGAVDLARAYHLRADDAMERRLAEADLSDLSFREKVARAIRFRLEVIDDKEAVRRASVLFSLPHLAADGAALIWGTADRIWEALGDTSSDYNWYTKRATLSAVYGSSVLFWLGDDSSDHSNTWEFIDRRIENVMQIEKLKAQVEANPLLSRMAAPLNWALSHVKAPVRPPRADLPGQWLNPDP